MKSNILQDVNMIYQASIEVQVRGVDDARIIECFPRPRVAQRETRTATVMLIAG
jgi:hypothetical protein